MIRLKQALEVKGITLKACSQLLGIAEKTLYNKISGATEFTYSEVQKLRSLLPEYNIDYLLGLDEGKED